MADEGLVTANLFVTGQDASSDDVFHSKCLLIPPWIIVSINTAYLYLLPVENRHCLCKSSMQTAPLKLKVTYLVTPDLT